MTEGPDVMAKFPLSVADWQIFPLNGCGFQTNRSWELNFSLSVAGPMINRPIIGVGNQIIRYFPTVRIGYRYI